MKSSISPSSPININRIALSRLSSRTSGSTSIGAIVAGIVVVGAVRAVLPKFGTESHSASDNGECRQMIIRLLTRGLQRLLSHEHACPSHSNGWPRSVPAHGTRGAEGYCQKERQSDIKSNSNEGSVQISIHLEKAEKVDGARTLLLFRRSRPLLPRSAC